MRNRISSTACSYSSTTAPQKGQGLGTGFGSLAATHPIPRLAVKASTLLIAKPCHEKPKTACVDAFSVHDADYLTFEYHRHPVTQSENLV